MAGSNDPDNPAMQATTGQEYLTAAQAAAELHVSPRTIRRAVQRGQLEAYRIGPRGHFRIRTEALEEWLQPVRATTTPTEEA